MASDRMIEALHRYNIGPEWTRAEVVDLVKAMEREHEAESEELRENVRTMVEMLMDDPAQMARHAAGCLVGLVASPTERAS